MATTFDLPAHALPASVRTSPQSQPGDRRRMAAWQPRRYGFWLFLALFGTGVALQGMEFVAIARPYPALFLLALGLWALYALPFLVLFHRMNLFGRTPASLRVSAFLWGSLAAGVLAAQGNEAMSELVFKLGGPRFAADWNGAIGVPVNEELLKVLGVVLLVLIARERLTRPLDGLLYGVLCGFGFQVVENIIYTCDAYAGTPNDEHIPSIINVFLLRGLNLGGHWVYSGLAGLGVAYAITRPHRSRLRRAAVAIGLLLVASLLHFLWNSPLAKLADEAGLAHTVTWGRHEVSFNAVMMALDVLGLVFFLLAYRYAVRLERHRFATSGGGDQREVIAAEERDTRWPPVAGDGGPGECQAALPAAAALLR